MSDLTPEECVRAQKERNDAFVDAEFNRICQEVAVSEKPVVDVIPKEPVFWEVLTRLRQLFDVEANKRVAKNGISFVMVYTIREKGRIRLSENWTWVGRSK